MSGSGESLRTFFKLAGRFGKLYIGRFSFLLKVGIFWWRFHTFSLLLSTHLHHQPGEQSSQALKMLLLHPMYIFCPLSSNSMQCRNPLCGIVQLPNAFTCAIHPAPYSKLVKSFNCPLLLLLSVGSSRTSIPGPTECDRLVFGKT
jgi:hypothetical protein